VAVARDGQTFRIMVQSFTGEDAHPVVNVYCGGRRLATYGQEPDTLTDFSGPNGNTSIGAMWRVADVTVRVDPSTGETTGCDVRALHPPGAIRGYDVTIENRRY
jgi:hypothetical protein